MRKTTGARIGTGYSTDLGAAALAAAGSVLHRCRRMRIVYDYQVFSFQQRGGISRYFVELVRHLSRIAGVEASILAPVHVNEHVTELAPDLVRGVRVPRVRGLGPALRALNLGLSRVAGSAAPDVLHETYFRARPLPGAAHLPTVLSVYDMIHERFPERFPASDGTREAKRRAVSRADRVICISESTRKDLIDITGTSPYKVSTVHLGVSPLVGTPGGGAPRPDLPYILYVGDRTGHKNFEGLLRAYASRPELLRGFGLVCFGGGSLRREEWRLARELGVPPERLVCAGGDDARLAATYDHASVFVYPSLYEGFGLPPLEAMSRDCPVACSDQGSIPEIVGPAGEYFDPREPEQIASAILRVVDSPERADQLRALGRQRIRSFTWESCARETLAVYRQLA